MRKEIAYIDLDGTIVDFQSGIDRLDAGTRAEYAGRLDEVPGIFALMDPIEGAIEAVTELAERFDVYILSTAPWLNPTAWADKLGFVHDRFGKVEGTPMHKRLILSHHKELNIGDYLVDDRPHNGAAQFKGEWIKFGTSYYQDYAHKQNFSTWNSVLDYLVPLPLGEPRLHLLNRS